MCNNILEWGDCYFLQLLGTAMGTSATCVWATIYLVVHETLSLVPKVNKTLWLFLRFMDDITGIWSGNPLEHSWEDFENETNDLGISEFECEEPSEKAHFLDLTISIKNENISTKTFQKALHLYQYLGPGSNHPPGMIKSVIYSLLNTCKNQNTHTEDYLDVVIKPFHRHAAARGWNRTVPKRRIPERKSKLEKTLLLPHRVTPCPPPAPPRRTSSAVPTGGSSMRNAAKVTCPKELSDPSWKLHSKTQ